MKKDLDTTKFHRQLGMVDPELLYNLNIRILGVGAIGSMVSIALAKMGVGTLEIWDPDCVKVHNLPNQFYRTADVGQSKVGALNRTLMEDFGAFEVVPYYRKYDPKNVSENAALPRADIVICAVDSMAFRKELWLENIKNKLFPKLYIETRMGGEEFRIYSFCPTDSRAHAPYEAQLYSSDDADGTPCTEKSILYNVMCIASLVGNSVKKHATADPDIPFEVLGNFPNNLFMFNSVPVPATAE